MISKTKSIFVGNNQFSGKSKLDLFKEKYVIDKETGCWVWIARRNKKGYGQFGFDGKLCQAHRVSWIIYYGDIPDGMFVLHHCDNTSCVNPYHLFLGTNADNMRDMASKGRSTRGNKSHTCKLSEDQVKEIRSLNLSGRKTAKKYGISSSVVYQIRTKKIWAWLD